MCTLSRSTLAMALLGVAALCGGTPGSACAQEREAEIVQAVCVDCHDGIEWYRLEALDHADSLTCRTCHHVGFSNDPEVVRLRRTEQCRDCHDEISESHSGVGDRAPECTECHSIHGTQELTPAQVASARCGVCHSQPHPAHVPLAADAPGCADCHGVHTDTDEPLAEAATAGCASCHEAVHPAHDSGGGWFGGAPPPDGHEGEWVTCTACHDVDTGFDGAGSADAVCADCHAETVEVHAGHAADDVTCTGCHTLSLPLTGRRGQEAMDRSCGECHEEPWAAHRSGAHAESSGRIAAPGCTACHVFDGDIAEDETARRRLIQATVLCVECHEEQATLMPDEAHSRPGASYGNDFHGETVLFLAREGRLPPAENDVLVCSDCHGVHDVRLMERSEVAPVCDRCHADVGDELAGAWLGHEAPGPRNAWPVWLVRMGYTLLIPFMLIGLFLTIVFHLVDQRRGGARMWNAPGLRRLIERLRGRGETQVPKVGRFSWTERFEHLGSMVTFILLVVTGLPQTRPDLPVAHGIISVFGGIWTTRIIHRVVGVAFVALMLTHVVRAVVKALRTRRLPIMVPSRKDFEDIVQTFKHYLTGSPLPKVGKFDFSQKFEYWGLFLGGIVMSVSGAVLLFPEVFTQILPGIFIAAIRTVHGLEATFAVLVVVLWHSYGVILRPEIFPLDTTIFTGKMRVDRLKHEHALEYERLFGDEGGD